MKLRKRKLFISISLMAALMLPLGIDAAHFLIFHHHKISNPISSQVNINVSENHRICHYDFATEIVNNQNISLFIPLAYPNLFLELKTQSPKHSTPLLFSLRAPPLQNRL